MRVAIDLRMVGAVPHGIARYALALWNGLPQRSDRTYLALTSAHTTSVRPRRPGDEILPTRAPFLSPLEQIELPLALRLARVDLLHATSFSVPAAWRGPLVLSLHDLTHLDTPELHTPLRSLYYRHIVGPAARRAAVVLTVSAYAKARLVELLTVPADRIVVAPNAVDLPIPADARREGGVPLLLAVGNDKPHKNLQLLVDMQPLLTQPARLVLVGANLERFAKRGIEVAGTVDDQRLAQLYREATLFLCPSRTEGFGLPPLEAARLGAPVLVSRAGALDEIWAGAARLLPPTDPRAWATAVDDLLTDHTARDALAQRCVQRALEYSSWDRLIQAAESAYRKGSRNQGTY